ncbi:flippase [Flavobacteriales bacterium]|nr:flippase [Flavobacteriales bacterium]
MKDKFINALQDKDFSELFKKGGLSFLIRIGGQVMGFLLALIIARYFGASGLGDYVLAIVVLRVFAMISKLGVDITSIRVIASFSSQNKFKSIKYFRKKIVLLLIATTLVFSSIMYFNAVLLASFIGANPEYIKLNSFLVLPMTFFILHYQSLRGLKKIAEFSFFYRMSETLFTIVSILVIMQFNKDASVPIYGYVTSMCIVSILTFISYNYWFNVKSKEGINEQELDLMPLKNILAISMPLMFAQSVQFIMAWTDKLMIGNMMTSQDVGIYHIAFKLSMFATIGLMAINSIAAPKFAELYAKQDFEGLKKVVNQSTKFIFWSTIPLVVIFFIFPEFLLGLFGDEFKIGVAAFIFLSCGRLISSFSGSVGNLLQMTGKQVMFMNILFAGACINVALNYLLIPSDNLFAEFGVSGINGAALASMISLSTWNLAMVYFVKREFGFYTFYNPFSK